uniref:LuxR family transcriptional regulator n=1 Tax=Agrobacterium albertimagni TaxID=147266 RepID=A0A7C1NYU3_9HYPH
MTDDEQFEDHTAVIEQNQQDAVIERMLDLQYYRPWKRLEGDELTSGLSKVCEELGFDSWLYVAGIFGRRPPADIMFMGGTDFFEINARNLLMGGRELRLHEFLTSRRPITLRPSPIGQHRDCTPFDFLVANQQHSYFIFPAISKENFVAVLVVSHHDPRHQIPPSVQHSLLSTSVSTFKSVTSCAAYLAPSNSDIGRLSNRQKAVLGCLCEGYTNVETAEKLGINRRTVDYHVSTIFRKLNVNDRYTAARVLSRVTAP